MCLSVGLVSVSLLLQCCCTSWKSQIARFMGPTWGPLGPVGPRWVPCWPHESCYRGYVLDRSLSLSLFPCLSFSVSLLCQVSHSVFPLWKHWVLPLHTATIAGTMSTRNTQYKHLTSLYSLLITYAAHVSASIQWVPLSMMTSWHENHFHITGHLWGESSGRASDIRSV